MKYRNPKQEYNRVMEKIIKWESFKPNNVSVKEYNKILEDLWFKKKEVQAQLNKLNKI